MSKKKFFTLIRGDSVHIAPKTKVLPESEYSTLITAAEALEAVKKDAEAYKLQVAKECEAIKAKAEKEGFAEGFKKWAEHIGQLEAEIKKVRRDLETMLAPVALKAAKKIVGREIELSQDTIVDIVATALKAVSQHKKITIWVNKKDLEPLEANRGRLKQIFENLEALSIRERVDIAPGGCVIETEGGIINAQLENQWRVLEKAFENLMKTTKEPVH